MLVLSRKLGESIQIGNGITVQVVHLDRTRVRLGITAPSGTMVARAEILDSRDQPGSAERNGTKPEGDEPEGG